MNVYASSKPNPRASNSFDNRSPADVTRHAQNESKDTNNSIAFHNETVSLTSIDVMH